VFALSPCPLPRMSGGGESKGWGFAIPGLTPRATFLRPFRAEEST
jgi:hypothetical protein